jgi:hypothetical protein
MNQIKPNLAGMAIGVALNLQQNIGLITITILFFKCSVFSNFWVVSL